MLGSSDFTMFTTYSLRRSFNILDKNPLKAYLKAMDRPYSAFQRPLKANSGPSFLCDLAHRVLRPLCLGWCSALKIR